MTFMNAGLGVFTKMTFPTLPAMVEFENCVLVRAVFIINQLFGANMDLPNSEIFHYTRQRSITIWMLC